MALRNPFSGVTTQITGLCPATWNSEKARPENPVQIYGVSRCEGKHSFD